MTVGMVIFLFTTSSTFSKNTGFVHVGKTEKICRWVSYLIMVLVISTAFKDWGFCWDIIKSNCPSFNFWMFWKREPNNGVTCLVVGGAQESLCGNESTVELTLLNRKGFVKLALETGAHLLPCFAFGEQQIFNLHSEKGSRVRRFQEFLKKCTTIAPVIFTGRGIFQYSWVFQTFIW